MCQLMLVDWPFGLCLADVLPISAGLTRASGVSSVPAEMCWSRGQAVWSLLCGHPESSREHVLVCSSEAVVESSGFRTIGWR